MAFDAQSKLTKIKGKDYLEVKWRIAWFRDAHPAGAIDTQVIQVEPCYIIKATVDVDGRQVASGMGSAPAFGKGQSTWKGRELEKAETAAIGRALAVAGFGTQFTADEFDEGEHIADAPSAPQPRKQSQPQQEPAKQSVRVLSGQTQVQVVKRFDNTRIVIGGATLFSREPFRQLGYADYVIEALGDVGNVVLEHPVTIAYVEEDGYNKIISVMREDKRTVYDVETKTIREAKAA